MNSGSRLLAVPGKSVHALALAFAATGAPPGEPALDAAVRAVSHDFVAAIVQDRDIRTRDVRTLAELGEKIILPHVDRERITRLAMGAIWGQADAGQKQRLAREFTPLLVRAYAAALASVIDQPAVISRSRAETRDNDVAVKFEISRSEAQPITIDYSVARTLAGWKVYDIRISGVSLVTIYHTAFSEEARNYGIEGLIALISNRNRESGRRVAPARSVGARAHGGIPEKT